MIYYKNYPDDATLRYNSGLKIIRADIDLTKETNNLSSIRRKKFTMLKSKMLTFDILRLTDRIKNMTIYLR